MSHYCVAVFSDDGDFDRLLDPYDESNHKRFTPVDEEEMVKRFEEKVLPRNEGLTYEEYLNTWGYCRDEHGRLGYNANPNAKWDWYSLDGKEYMFPMKDGEMYDENGLSRKNQHDYSVPQEEIDDHAKFWDEYVELGMPGRSLFTRDYYRERYSSKEQYLKEISIAAPYAFITPDGVWHAPGTVGWFATSDETEETMNKYLEEWEAYLASDADPYVSFVDCHI